MDIINSKWGRELSHYQAGDTGLYETSAFDEESKILKYLPQGNIHFGLKFLKKKKKSQQKTNKKKHLDFEHDTFS